MLLNFFKSTFMPDTEDAFKVKKKLEKNGKLRDN